MNIGKRLKIARKAIGYTMNEVSDVTGIGESSLSDFENSKREPAISHLSKLADIYKKTLDFFLTDEPLIDDILLWRDCPSGEKEKKVIEAEFKKLCNQYRNLEIIMDDVKDNLQLPEPDILSEQDFDWNAAELFATKVKNSFNLGEIPIRDLKRILEETYYIKIFYLPFTGSAISVLSREFGPAILLNSTNKQWRRSFDLCHELFHLLTWKIFRANNQDTFMPNQKEEKLANVFASRLLMPADTVKNAVEQNLNDKREITFDKLEDISRQFDVSLEALIYRIANIYYFKKEKTQLMKTAADNYLNFMKPRDSKEPEQLPERYCELARRALREGKISTIQFAKYMGISYKNAQEYIAKEEEFTDEKIEICAS